ncbi:protein DpdD [Ramlibacter montanisoli]|uniref:Uncharacterized protein n=1 Tax=Ramlibacter montanisoli TaxID=2732512 RepID=A0A849K8S0_9BURK|nr:protein DpdD [Ramlibacter montanisoli]NNU44772.1 hypothetical protein [Ramlibacter montanisoli]
MSTPETDAAATQALELQAGFFRPPNLFRLLPQDCPEELAPTMAALQGELWHHAKGQVDRPLLLPVRLEGDVFTVWYACAASECQLRALEAELKAFIGPTYAWFRLPEDGRFDADRHAQPLLRRGGLRHFVMWTQGPEQDGRLLHKWRMYRDLLERRPAIVARIPKSFDALRADFDRALLARDERAAHLALSAMRDRFGISAENRLYLEIRLFAGLEHWDRIAGHRLLSTLTKLNLPQETYGDVLEGLYMADVFPFEQGAPLDRVLEEFKGNLLERAYPLFRTRRQSQRPAVLKAFVLFELLQPSPQAEVVNLLLQQLPGGAWGALEAQVRQAVTHLQTPVDPASDAWQAYEHEQFDRATDLLWPLPDSVDVLRALIRCVDESRNLQRAQALKERIEAAPPPVQADVEARCPKTWPRVRELARLAPADQMTWAQRMAWHPNLGESIDAYVDRWKEWARVAEVDELLREQDFGTEAANLLEQLALEYPAVFGRIAPLWHEVFVARAEPRPQCKPVYAALLETLRLPGTFSDVDLRLVRDVLKHLVQAGLTAPEYAKTLEDIGLVFEQVRSPHHMRWALDVCDVLAMEACPEPAARLRLLTATTVAGQEFASRIGELEIAMLLMLAQEAGIDLALPQRVTAPGSSAGRQSAEVGTIGIYTLDEAAGRRAVQILQSTYGPIDVRLNSDSVCTPQLKALVQRSAIFVFAWKTSKHAAYYCIKAASRPDQPLEMAQGAGTSSMVDAVAQFMAKRASQAS